MENSVSNKHEYLQGKIKIKWIFFFVPNPVRSFKFNISATGGFSFSCQHLHQLRTVSSPPAGCGGCSPHGHHISPTTTPSPRRPPVSAPSCSRPRWSRARHRFEVRSPTRRTPRRGSSHPSSPERLPRQKQRGNIRKLHHLSGIFCMYPHHCCSHPYFYWNNLSEFSLSNVRSPLFYKASCHTLEEPFEELVVNSQNRCRPN